MATVPTLIMPEVRTSDSRRHSVEDLLAECSDLDDGTGTLGIIVREALRMDPAATESDIRAIVREALADATAERE